MSVDKTHYYDGLPYELVIDRALRGVRRAIVRQVPLDSSVIDIGCGTGALVYELAENCTSVVGVDLSNKMISYAKNRQHPKKNDNVYFLHDDATRLSQFEDRQFDYAIISMVLHEASVDVRMNLLTEAKRIAKTIIIADYVAPLPFNVMGIFMRIAEFLAGADHFSGFTSYQKNKGMDELLRNCRLSVNEEFPVMGGTIKIVTVTQKTV